ncbi:hypothetical protein AB1Y20_006118 [Prymnesium parvum]|uniref:Uncharacterized protein n=1 Tax=Prymnesium parvum TaxID=97485 RepID=A0AB34J3S8_PRYPA
MRTLRRLSSPSLPPQQLLTGHVAWVVGGVGPIGSGIARAFLRAGATVLVNSRYNHRLEVLSEELGHPEKLIPIHSTMLAPGSEETVRRAMSLTAGRLDHVVAHSSVRWWRKAGDCDETATTPLIPRGRMFELTADEFGVYASQLPRLHFEAGRLLLPRLNSRDRTAASTYTFVTGGEPIHLEPRHGLWARVQGESSESRTSLGHVNAQAMWGLAAAVRREMRDQPVTVSEVRLNMRFNRPLEERLDDPRDEPLTHNLGSICAGIASSPSKAGGLHTIDSQRDIEALQGRFPTVEKPYGVYFRAPDLG